WGEWRFIRLKKDQGELYIGAFSGKVYGRELEWTGFLANKARAVKVSVDYGEFGQFAEWLGILALKY
ncbi:12798_t:CDS:2, partial [Entrophospora sp. SA101]